MRLHLGLELLESTKKNLMISKIVSREACLAELTSNPKSFFNCPDLHGGSGLPEGSFPSMSTVSAISIVPFEGGAGETVRRVAEGGRILTFKI